MRDERIAPKGWPKDQRSRRSGKASRFHYDWTKRNLERSEFNPAGRKEGSDYNLHYLDVDGPLDTAIEFDRRVREIDGRDPDTKWRLPEPDAGDRFRGAVLAAAVGDAFGLAVGSGAVMGLPWTPNVSFTEEERLTEYLLRDRSVPPSAITQQIAFTLEGLIRAHTARRLNPVDADPIPEVRHAYQRWLYTQRVSWGQRGKWQEWGGSFALRSPEPDGWLVQTEAMFGDRAADSATVAALESFARDGSQPKSEGGGVMGAEVVPRAAMAAVWSNDPSEVFSTAVNIAMLTHPNPDDYLPAGALAVLLHQQIRDVPFFDCLRSAVAELRKWPAREKTIWMLREAFGMNRKKHWVPATRDQMRIPFGEGGSDGAEALGLAMYCAMASDYVREAVLLAMNYSEHRSVVGAISGLLIGAECGVRAVPRELSEVLVLRDVVQTLTDEVLLEFSPGPPRDQTWTQRYPAW
ncbi:ADP-ribosylglycohydrolase family protein [Saccharopolyspora shandongensis]|uniref:ADP-ribosylglycohydrolase family protein n=1 Tax=Saccharopolyspora shandongensis TaxID=418495 RepID=UPI0033CA4BBB